MGSKNANKKNHNKIKGKKGKKKKKAKDNLKADHSPPCHDKVISDPRFSRVHTDPRFREAPKDETKVVVDSRFDHMFTHNSFLPCSAPIDKRGKPKDNLTSKPDFLRHYYYKIVVEDNRKVENTSDEDKVEEEGLLEENDKEAESEETNESESTTDKDTDTDEGIDEEVYEEETLDMQEEITKIEKETYRLAVVNMDWRCVEAVDLYVVFCSFVPPNGMIKSVAVYPTEFGLQCMKEEEIHGPIGLLDDENEKSDEDTNDDYIDHEKLHAYEKSRMRYYHAVVECDSSTTAACIYKACDGLEFLFNPLDLRFIPNNMEFKQTPRDVATEAPVNYDVKDICSRALQHSKVDLTWDEDEPLRAKTLRRKFNDEQLAQLELKDFLTSDVSESDDGEDNNDTGDQPDKKERKQDEYRRLLSSGNGSDEDAEHDVVQDMEVTFLGDSINKHIMPKKDKKSETDWEAYLRKRREKKKARKNKSKYSSDGDSDDSDQEATEEADEFFIEEPAVKKRKKAQSKNDKDNKLQHMDRVDKASKEELELLLADDKATDTGLKGYNLKFKEGKGKKRENGIDEGKVPNSAHDDPRFAASFSPGYAIDPTDPQFKRSAAYARQLAQKQQKGKMELSAERELEKLPKRMQLSSEDSGMMQKDKKEGLGLRVLKSKKDEYELSSLVKSLKMKSKQFLLSSDGKTRKDGKSQFKGVRH